MSTTGTVTVRMYNMGFGDAFVVTVRRGDHHWRLLVDCGVHSQGAARPLTEMVQTIVTDLAQDGPPHLHAVVATHHHADHIAGFADELWHTVHVDEVWLPYVEDLDDPVAQQLRKAQTLALSGLNRLIGARRLELNGTLNAALAAADVFAVNSSRNEKANDRLTGRSGTGFANQPLVRYLPSTTAQNNQFSVGEVNLTVHVLGPSRDPGLLKRMDPPRSAGWFRFDDDLDSSTTIGDLFNSEYCLADDDDRVPADLRRARDRLRLDRVSNDEAVLTAASLLERSVNNTSLFFVLDVAGTKLIFPGDAQQGAWEHVLNNPESRALLADATFYKIAHHGSHNATPKTFVEDVWADQGWSMLPWGSVKRWDHAIPKAELLQALSDHQHPVVRADTQPWPDVTRDDDNRWVELTLTTA